MRLFATIAIGLFLMPAVAFGALASECDDSPLCSCDDYSVPNSGVQECWDECEGSLQCTIDGSITSVESTECDPDADETSFDCYSAASSDGEDSEASSTTEEKKDHDAPSLSIHIPGLDLSPSTASGSSIEVNYIGQYVNALYSWLIGAGSLIAVVVLMVSGVQYMMARGNASLVTQAKERMTNAVIGLVLLLGAYAIANFIDPATVNFDTLKLDSIGKMLDKSTSGEEGASGGGDQTKCDEVLAKASTEGSCPIDNFMAPASGVGLSCNYHFSDADYNYKDQKSLDYPGIWGTPLLASFDGEVEYVEGGGSNRCGNQINLKGSGISIIYCHAKNFVDSQGNMRESGTKVVQGEVLGHLGGVACGGQADIPKHWKYRDRMLNGPSGTACKTVNSLETCSCQTWQHSGHTTGSHVHIELKYGGNLLTCVANGLDTAEATGDTGQAAPVEGDH